MIVDFTEAGKAALAGRTFDVGIIGAGPAGITLATNLSPALGVLLIEAGGLDFSEESQDVYRGTTTGREYYELDAARLRYFGGTSNHWGGRCQTLDEWDFEPRPYVALSGWPIDRKDLNPYLDRAAQILDLDPAAAECGGCGPQAAYLTGFNQAICGNEDLRPYHFLFSPPTRFGTKYQAAIEQSQNITCLLRANLTDILLNDGATAVTGVEITGYDKQKATVPVRRLIIAAGGMENPRILLNCNKQIKAGIGNQHDLVGRFFMEHLNSFCGWLVLQDDLRDAVVAAYGSEPGDQRRKLYYAPTPKFARANGISDFMLLAILESGAHARNDTFSERLRHAMCESDWISEGLDLLLDGKPTCYDGYFMVTAEQEPNPDCRVSLIEDTDQFGWRRINFNFQTLPIDKHTCAVAATQFAAQFATHDFGRVRVEDWILADDAEIPSHGLHNGGSYHHMGATRMADNPKNGVVDRDCRVHGIDNLFIAGSSVFPTCGFVNPTFSIVQLSLRLANKLNSL